MEITVEVSLTYPQNSEQGRRARLRLHGPSGTMVFDLDPEQYLAIMAGAVTTISGQVTPPRSSTPPVQ